MSAEEILKKHYLRDPECYPEMYEDWTKSESYQSMIAAMKEYASTQVSGGLRFVCAAKKLPPEGKDCNLKIDNNPFSGRFWEADSDAITKISFRHFNVAGKTILDSSAFHRIWWLDEGESLTPVSEDWIKVDGKNYPPENVGVFVMIPDEDYHVTSGMWDVSKKWVLLDEYRVPDCEVTHWRRLPDVPEEFKKDIADNYKVMGLLGEIIRNEKRSTQSKQIKG